MPIKPKLLLLLFNFLFLYGLLAQTETRKVALGINIFNVLNNFGMPERMRLGLNINYSGKKLRGPLLSVNYGKSDYGGFTSGLYTTEWDTEALLILTGYSWKMPIKRSKIHNYRIGFSGGYYQCRSIGLRKFANAYYPAHLYIEPFSQKLGAWVIEESFGANYRLNKRMSFEPSFILGYRSASPGYDNWKIERTPLLGVYLPSLYFRLQVMLWFNVYWKNK